MRTKSFLLSLFMTFALAFSVASLAFADEDASKIPGENMKLGEALVLSSISALSDGAEGDLSAQATATTAEVNKPTQDQIRNYLLNKKISADKGVSYTTKPSYSSPGKAGAVDQASLNNGLNMLNWMRYIAGIPDNVTLDSKYNEQCQAGALLLRWTKSLLQSPSKPSGMDDALYRTAVSGTASSNSSSGYAGIAASVLGYMSDSTSANLATVGQRRWCLNPQMAKTGFGYVDGYSCMYIADKSNASAPRYENLVWPANNTPTSIFSRNDPWSFTASWIQPDDTSLTVNIKRENDGKTWNFSNPNGSVSGGGYFKVSGAGYGDSSSYLVFQPYTNGKAGLDRLYDQDKYTVTIKSTKRNKSYTYTVTFFNLYTPDQLTVKKAGGSTIGTSVSFPINSYKLDVEAVSTSSKAPKAGSSQYFSGLDHYIAVDGNEFATTWSSSNTKAIDAKYGSAGGFSYDRSCALFAKALGKSTITVKRANASKSFTCEITKAVSNDTGNNSSSNNSSNNSSSSSNTSTALTPAGNSSTIAQAAPKAPSVTGTWKKSSGKWWFSYDSKSKTAQKKSYPANEWVTIKGKRYHFDSKGYMSSKWYKSGSSWYWLGTDGAMKTGWQKVSGKWYFMERNGIMQTGKRKISNQTYYLTSSGAMKTGWNKESNKWYYYKSSGAMAKGWAKVKNKWYYLNPSDGVMKTGFYDVNKVRYYSNSSGAMQTGWKKLSNKWYYFSKSGAMQKNKWISGNYWVGSDGVMATNSWVGTDVKHLYYVDGNGKWVRGAKLPI